MKIFDTSLFILLIFPITSCKKESSGNQTNANLLCKQNWKLQSLRFNTNNGAWTDGLATVPDCRKDDITFFYLDNKYHLEEGETKCNVANPQIIEEGTWSISSDGKQLITVRSGLMHSIVNISLLDESNLHTTKRDTSGSNISILEAKYVH
jgi:hypothetical protein